MKERPVIFNGEMVRAILEGRKTQTRRVMNFQPKPSETRPGDFWFSSKKLESMVHVSDFMPGNSPITDCHYFFQEHCCPFGQIGDRLWVREAFRVHSRATDVATLVYRASEHNSWTEQTRRVPVSNCSKPVSPEKWTPSIHMPRWASRILLEITAVRVERLNSISQEDAQAEGYLVEREVDGGSHDPWLWFRGLWDGIYPDNDFKVNPWVWVIEFRRVEVRP